MISKLKTLFVPILAPLFSKSLFPKDVFPMNIFSKDGWCSKERMTRLLFHSFFFLPGALLMSVAFSVVFAPNLVLCFVAALFLFLGVAGIYLGWRILLFKSKIERVARDIEARIIIQGVNVRPPEMTEDFEGEFEEVIDGVKKIQYH